MITFLSGKAYLQAIGRLLREDSSLHVAVAFWGEGAQDLFAAAQGRIVKLVCNLESGASNPTVVKTLRDANKGVVRSHASLHAKVLVGLNSVIVGSANISANGLNFEGSEELEGWVEAGLLIADRAIVAQTRSWVEKTWAAAHEIHDSDLRRAAQAWKRRRFARVVAPGIASEANPMVWELPLATLRDRDVHVAIYRETLSDGVEKASVKEAKKQKDKFGPIATRRDVMIYEDWDLMPMDVPLIDVYYGWRGAIQCHGASRIRHETKIKKHTVHIGALEPMIMGRPFGAQQWRAFEKWLKPRLGKVWEVIGKADPEGTVLPLHDLVRHARRLGA